MTTNAPPESRRLLCALESSTLVGSVAICDLSSGEVLSEVVADASAQSHTLMALVDQAMIQIGASPNALDVIACGIGPGSFTGLRIALATAKGLCFSLGAKLVTISSLDAIAARIPASAAEHPAALVITDARKAHYFFALYERDAAGGEWKRTGDPRSVPAAELVDETDAALAGRAAYAIGSGTSALPDHRSICKIADQAPPSAREIARLAFQRYRRGESDAVSVAEPCYASEWSSPSAMPNQILEQNPQIQADLERFRESGLSLDREGRFWHEGAEVTHQGLLRALYRWLDVLPDGRTILRLDPVRYAYVDVADVPLVVRSARWEGDRIWLNLPDGSSEELAYNTLTIRADGSAVVKVRKGLLAARLSPSAWTVVSRGIEQSGDGETADAKHTLVAHGQRWPILVG